ncbi:MAG: hypothetical protein HYU67_02885 [Flavobacteriia bacterium]|nr:hypothetical protein [Flavobacteriia bacterium]
MGHINPYFIFPETSEDLLLLKKQLFKDFSPFISCFPENFLTFDYNSLEIVEFTQKSIEFVLSNNQQSLMQVLNRVDIEDKVLKKIFLNVDFIESLKWEILKKECQKIIWRKKFK